MSQPKKPAAKDPHHEREHLASSHGDDPVLTTPKDVEQGHASSRDMRTRPVSSADPAEREEALLDEAIDETFPASDPIAPPSYDPTLEKRKQQRAAQQKDR